MDNKILSERMQILSQANYGKDLPSLTEREFWQILSRTIMSLLAPKWEATRYANIDQRQAHYFSAEFLVGRSLLNNLINLNLYDTVRDFAADQGYDLMDIMAVSYTHLDVYKRQQ